MKLVIKIFVLVFVSAFVQATYAQTFLTKEEMLATFPGAKIGGISSSDGKSAWEQTYGHPKAGKTKGKGKGLWKKKDTYKFKWYIKKGKWCENWGSGKACWDVELVDDVTIQMYKKGKKLPQVWNILEPAS